ncbi:pre-mRNA-splicing factor 38B-like [Rhopilema esculentum]|uniref:pre-mRNA-splicing factor 38B-like n=1 Tax=Rhopilema esculentum TaxID=499914 RepID=UPI0031E2830E
MKHFKILKALLHFKMDVEDSENRKKKQGNAIQTWGNAMTMNINNMIHTNILSSPYFKTDLFTLKTYHEVVDEIYYKVSHLEPWEKGSRKTSGQVGMCGGVRGVGAGGIVSSCYCLLFKMFTLKLTRKQLKGLIDHCDSPYIRGIGFMYIRYCLQPKELWSWLEPYLEDEEELDVKAGGGCTMTIGQLVRSFLLKLEWYGTLFPRIPVPVEKDIRERLTELNLCDDHKRKADEGWGEAERYAKSKREEDGEYRTRGEADFGEAEKYSKMHHRSRSRDRSVRDERPREARRRRSPSVERPSRNVDRRSKSRERSPRRRSPRRRSRSAERARHRQSRSGDRSRRSDRRSLSKERVRNRLRRSRSREKRSRSRDAVSKERQAKHGDKVRTGRRSSRSRSRDLERTRRSLSRDRRNRGRDMRSRSKEKAHRSYSNERSRESRERKSYSKDRYNSEKKIPREDDGLDAQNGKDVNDRKSTSKDRPRSSEDDNRKLQSKRERDRSSSLGKDKKSRAAQVQDGVDEKSRIEDDDLEAGELRDGSEVEEERHKKSKSKQKKKKSRRKEGDEDGDTGKRKHRHKKTKKKHKEDIHMEEES